MNKKYLLIIIIFLTISSIYIGSAFLKKKFTMNVNVQGSGIVEVNSNENRQIEVEEGSKVELNAIPSTGWIFLHWEGNLNNNSSNVILTIQKNYNVTAVFIRTSKIEILVYSDESLPIQERPVIKALENLSYNYTIANTYLDFKNNLNIGKNWDIVILNEENGQGEVEVYNQLSNYIDSGGKIIVVTKNIKNYSDNTLWNKLQVKYLEDIIIIDNGKINFSDMNNKIVNYPNKLSESITIIDKETSGIFGSIVTPINNGISIASLTNDKNIDKPIIVLGDKKTIFNGILLNLLDQDDNKNGKTDVIDLWENEMQFLLN